MTYRPLRRIDYLDALLAHPRCDIHPDTLRQSNVADLKVLAAWYQIPVYPWEAMGTGCVTTSDDREDEDVSEQSEAG